VVVDKYGTNKGILNVMNANKLIIDKEVIKKEAIDRECD
jgi:hypothetical protein